MRSAWRTRTLVVAFSLLGLAACGSAKPPLGPGESRVASVAIEPVSGSKITVSKSDITDGLALERARRRGEPFERYLLAIDEQRVHGWYVRHGFFRAQVHADAAEQKAKKDAVDVVFRADEGKRAKLARVEIAGLPTDADVDAGALRSEIRKLIPIDDGGTFDYDAVDKVRDQLRNALGAHGYARAHLTSSIAADQVTDEAIVRLEYTAGPRCKFGRITVKGVEGPLAGSTRDRLAIKSGAMYSTVDLDESRAALYDMKRFAMVRIEPDLSGDGDEIPVTIEVTKSTSHELRLGGGVGMNPTSYEVRGKAGYSITGFPTDLETTHLEFKPAMVRLRDTGQWEPRIEALASLERMDLFRTFLTGTAEVGLEWITVEAYTTDGPHVQLGLKSPLWGRRLQGSVAWRLSELEARNLSPAITPDLAHQLGLDVGSYRLGYFEQALIADLRDDPVEPRFGAYGEIRAHEGTQFAGGQFTYLRLVPELRGYVALGPVVFASRARVGWINGARPFTERFFGGGANSMRGFGERRLSPFADTMMGTTVIHVPYGGGALAEVSEEVRFPIGMLLGVNVGGVTFLDGGDDTETIGEIDPTHLHWAAGAGLRAHTAIGAIRFDVAWRLNRYGMGEPQAGDRLAFHLSIGEAF